MKCLPQLWVLCYRTTLMQGYDCCARRSSILRVVMGRYLPQLRAALFGISSMNDRNLFHEWLRLGQNTPRVRVVGSAREVMTRAGSPLSFDDLVILQHLRKPHLLSCS